MRVRLIARTPARVADHVRGQLGGRPELRVVAGRCCGARHIASRAAAAITGHAALDALAERRGSSTPDTDPGRGPLHRTGAMP